MRAVIRLMVVVAVAGGAGVLAARPALAHCDTMDGPVVRDGLAALSAGDLTPALKWLKPEGEGEVRDAFAEALKFRGAGPDARRLADRWFLETLVRVHRAGEGAPYTGLKPSGTPVEPAIAAADEAVASGSASKVLSELNEAIAAGVRERLARVVETQRHANESVEAGREFVEAYVIFIHYVERLHLDAATNPAHAAEAGVTDGTAEAEHGH